MAKNPRLPYIDPAYFQELVRNMQAPSFSTDHDVHQVAFVLKYLGEMYNWPSWTDPKKKAEFDQKILNGIERVDWSLYTDNFVYVPSKFYPYLEECLRRDDPFVEKIRATKFAKLCAMAYALVTDVHPDRRANLRPRIVAWSGLEIDEKAPTMLGALFDGWARHDASAVFGSYGSMLAALDPESSRSAAVLSNLLQQVEGQQSKELDSISFDFGSSL